MLMMVALRSLRLVVDPIHLDCALHFEDGFSIVVNRHILSKIQNDRELTRGTWIRDREWMTIQRVFFRMGSLIHKVYCMFLKNKMYVFDSFGGFLYVVVF